MTHPFHTAGHITHTAAPATRRQWLLATVATTAAIVLPLTARADAVEDAVANLQHEWEVIKYQTANTEREKRYEALATKAHQVSESYPGRGQPLTWEGIITASWANEKGGLGALGLVKKAKALYESAIRIDGSVLDGSAYTSLGVLYYKVPGWPVSFGDKDKAHDLLQKGLTLNPKGIDPNYFYGEFLWETHHPDEALTSLERALQAAPRPGRQISDAGRREEVRALIAKIKAR